MIAQRSGRTIERVAEYYGGFAFVGVVFAAFGQLLFFVDRLTISPWQLLAAFCGGSLYLVLGLLGGRWTDRGSRVSRAVYYLVQMVIVSTTVLLMPVPGFFGIIALPLAAQAVVDLRFPVAFLINLVLLTVCVAAFWIPWGARAALQAMVSFSPAFIFTGVFSYLTGRAFHLRHEAEELTKRLAAANTQLQEQSAQAEELATSRERNRLAREIHDGLGHYLTVINVQLDAARTLLERDPRGAEAALNKAFRLSREALDEVRASVANLHQGLAPPLPQRLQQLAQEDDGRVTFRLHGEPRRLPSAAEHALFRAAQEGLTNVRKHAGAAARAELTLDLTDPAHARLHLIDDGKCDAAPKSSDVSGFGLRGMRERVELLGGTISAGPRDRRGFELQVKLPG